MALLWLAVGCSPLRLLQPKQRLLTKVEVESKGLTQAQQERMLTLVQQKPNHNLPIPRLAVYQFGHSFYDSARIRRKAERIQADYTGKLEAAKTDSVQIGKLTARRDRRLQRKVTALEKGNAIMRLGEPPVIYDPDLSRRTVDQLSTYLRSQGFFRARVMYTDSARSKRSLVDGVLRTLQLRNKPVHAVPLRDSAGQRLHRRVTVTYQVQEGPDFTLSQLTRHIADTAVARVVNHSQGATLLHVGGAYNEDLIGQERQRLDALLKNAGYYDFRAQFITFEADTSFEKGKVRLGLLIASPEGGHRRYRLRSVTMLTDAGQGQALRSLTGDSARSERRARRTDRRTQLATSTSDDEGSTGRISTANMPAGVTAAAVSDSLTARRRNRRHLAPRDTIRIDSVAFASRGQLAINPRLLARQIVLRPGQFYDLTRTQRTTQLLGALDMFRFNNVSFSKVAAAKPPHPDSALVAPLADYYLDALVTSSPSPRFAETTEIGGTYVAGKPGPFANLRLKWRNPFHGAEVLELSGRVGFEGQYNRLGADNSKDLDAVYTIQYGVTAALLIPKLLVPFGLGNFLRDYQPRTRISLSQTYTSTPFYTRTNAEFTFDYLWQTSPYHQYIFTPVDLALVKTPFITQEYRDSLESYRVKRGSPLYQSFRSVYEPSFNFTSVYNSNDITQTRNARYLRLFVEVGGLTRQLYRTKEWFRGDRAPADQLEVYDFAKIAVDYRKYYRLSTQTYLAWRLNGGVAHALTPTPTASDPTHSTYTIPYDKYFFVGGSNSVRAWQPRRLGTGSYGTLKTDGTRDYITEQPGELLLEGSLEYRFPVYSFIRGALFTDFGNVWTLQPDPARPGAEFQFNSFAKQFAVGSGIGIRLDFTFLILRFDIATKVYDPTANVRWAVRDALRKTTNQTALNVGIGYPF